MLNLPFLLMMHSDSSHGVEVEAMSFLSLLAVVCFLQQNQFEIYLLTSFRAVRLAETRPCIKYIRFLYRML